MVQKGVNISYSGYPNTALKQLSINATIWKSPGPENIQILSLNTIMLSTMILEVTGGKNQFFALYKPADWLSQWDFKQRPPCGRSSNVHVVQAALSCVVVPHGETF
jgi:hypothetical protein